MAKAWGLTPVAYLRLPDRERRFCEAFMVAENIKQKASIEAQKAERSEQGASQTFDAQASAWASEVKKRWEATKKAKL